MKISVNDHWQDISDGLTLADLLSNMQINVRQVAVEVNLQLVPREQFATHHLIDGDKLEIVTLVGGG